MTQFSSSYNWIREVHPRLKDLDAVPLTGNAPPFPWDQFSAHLAQSFGYKELTVQPGEIKWRTKENLFEELGKEPVPLTFSIPSLYGEISWVMPLQEISILTALFLSEKASQPLNLYDRDFSESFYHFVVLQALYSFTQVSFDQALSPVLTQKRDLPNQDSLCWDIRLVLHNHTVLGRLIISPEFRHSWVQYFARREQNSSLSTKISQSTYLNIHLEIGETQLTLAQWSSIQLGDFLVLDKCSLDSDLCNGRLILTVNGQQALWANIKDRTLTILEFPLFHEVKTFMTRQLDDDFDERQKPEEDLEEEDFFSDADDLFVDDLTDLESEELSSSTNAPQDSSPSENEVTTTGEEPKKIFTAEQIPINLVVEIGQIQLTMEQLLKLEPGNMLDLNSAPEDGVDLTINGKVVGKGELIRIGEALGVRILQLGK